MYVCVSVCTYMYVCMCECMYVCVCMYVVYVLICIYVCQQRSNNGILQISEYNRKFSHVSVLRPSCTKSLVSES